MHEGAAVSQTGAVELQAAPTRFSVAFFCLAVPLGLLLFICNRRYEAFQQNICIGYSAGLLLLGILAFVLNTPFFGPRGGVLPLIAIGAALLLLAALLWNFQQSAYIQKTGYDDDAFRHAYQTLHAPVYGRSALLVPQPGVPLPRAPRGHQPVKRHRLLAALKEYSPLLLVPLVCGLFGWVYLRSDRMSVWRVVALLLPLQLALTVAAAFQESPDRLTDPDYASYALFASDVPAFDGAAELLRDWNQRMAHLHGFNAHYPPGTLLVFFWSSRLGAPGLTRWVTMFATVLAALPLLGLCNELGLDRRARTLGLILFCASTGAVNYPTISPTPLILLPATTAVWLWVRSLNRGGLACACGAGAALALAALISLTATLAVMVMGLFLLTLLVSRQGRGRRLGASALAGAAAFIACFALMDLAFHFNFFTCVVTAVADHHNQRGSPFDSAVRYLFRSTGQTLAYLMMCGLPISVLAFAAAVRWGREPRQSPVAFAFAAAGVSAVFVAGFSTLFLMETERVWLPLTPFLALAAAVELHCRRSTEGPRAIAAVVLMSLLITCAVTLAFIPWM